MSLECAECEQDLRGGHSEQCSRIQPQVSVELEGNQAKICLTASDRSSIITMSFDACVPSWWRYVAVHDDENSDTGVSICHRENTVFLGQKGVFGLVVSKAVWARVCASMLSARIG